MRVPCTSVAAATLAYQQHFMWVAPITTSDNMIVLLTDFGLCGPYGQMKAVLHQMAPGIPVIDLFADAPVGNPKSSASRSSPPRLLRHRTSLSRV